MKRDTRNLRCWVVAVAAAAGVACSSGGGGDGGGGNLDDEEVQLLPRYEFSLTSWPTDPIVVQVPMGEGASLQITHLGEGPGVYGDFVPDTLAFRIYGGSSIVVAEPGGAQQLFGSFDVEVTETWDIPVDARPPAGGLIVRRDDERIFLSVLPAGAGVNMEWDANNDGILDGEVALSWDAVFELSDGQAPEWQQLGSLGYSVLNEFMLELVGFGLDGLLLIDDELAELSPIQAPCDAFSGAGLVVPMPPPGIPDQGLIMFSWLDDAANGSVGPGDSFRMEFDYCWLEFPGEEGLLLNGAYGLNSWTEVVAGGFLVRTGFEGTSPAGRAGGLLFEDFEIWETWVQDGPGGGAVAHLGAAVNGRAVLVFYEPSD
jgi:hypothetical protein